jgi:hypothetical protein
MTNNLVREQWTIRQDKFNMQMMGVGSKIRSMAIPSTVLNQAKDSDTSSHGTLGAIYQMGGFQGSILFVFWDEKASVNTISKKRFLYFFMYFG